MKSRFQKVLRIAVCAMLVAILAVTTLLATGCGRTDFDGSTVPVDVNLPKDTAANLQNGCSGRREREDFGAGDHRRV